MLQRFRHSSVPLPGELGNLFLTASISSSDNKYVLSSAKFGNSNARVLIVTVPI